LSAVASIEVLAKLQLTIVLMAIVVEVLPELLVGDVHNPLLLNWHEHNLLVVVVAIVLALLSANRLVDLALIESAMPSRGGYCQGEGENEGKNESEHRKSPLGQTAVVFVKASNRTPKLIEHLVV
jgi:hypothetical protein